MPQKTINKAVKGKMKQTILTYFEKVFLCLLLNVSHTLEQLYSSINTVDLQPVKESFQSAFALIYRKRL